MKILYRLFLAVILIAFVSLPTSAQKVQTDYDHSVGFTQYHTYSWGQVHSTDPLFEQRIRDAVDHDLQAKGWQSIPEGGNATVTAIGVKRNQTEYQTFYDGFGPGWGWRGWGGPSTSTTTVEHVPVGSLVVDIYDTASQHLIWRGKACETLTNNPDKNTKKLTKAVNKLFAKFPPK
jgi:Domain of unknown function (DUF4136)